MATAKSTKSEQIILALNPAIQNSPAIKEAVTIANSLLKTTICLDVLNEIFEIWLHQASIFFRYNFLKLEYSRLPKSGLVFAQLSESWAFEIRIFHLPRLSLYIYLMV